MSARTTFQGVEVARTGENPPSNNLRVTFQGVEVIRNSPVVSSPDPEDGATDISTSPILSWFASEMPDSFDVYFGDTFPGTFQGNQTELSFSPGTLEPFTTYYWRIDGVVNGVAQVNTVWSFTTGEAGEVQTARPMVWVIT